MDIDVLNSLIGSWTLVLIPIVTGVTEIVKRFMPEAIAVKWTPALSLVIAILACLAAIGVTVPAIFTGVVIGLSASGLYSAVSIPFKKGG